MLKQKSVREIFVYQQKCQKWKFLKIVGRLILTYT